MWHTILCVIVLSAFSFADGVRYQPTWESIDSRPLPSWYDESKLGIFVHWGIFSVPSFSSEWFWHDWKQSKLPGIEAFMQENYRADFTYADFAKDFTAEFFIPEQWASIFNSSGAKYVKLHIHHIYCIFMFHYIFVLYCDLYTSINCIVFIIYLDFNM